MRSWSLVKGTLAYLGSWALYILFFASQTSTYALFTGRTVRWAQGFVYPVTDAVVWSVLAPGVWWLASRAPLERPRLAPRLLLHLGAALLAGVVASALAVVLLTGAGTVARSRLGEMFRGFAVGKLHSNLLLYMAVLGASHLRRLDRRARDRDLHAARLESHLSEARLLALRAQLHPHFLFNTLHAISALMHRDVEAADRMLARLGDLLRSVTEHSSAQEVPLREEVEFVTAYLEIQQIRLGERLRVALDVPADAHDGLVPYLLLQPLVENAIRHGIAVRAEGGRLEVRARRSSERLELLVRDDGPGLPRDGEAGGVGLRNTRERLAQLYGARHQMTLRTEPGRGLAVEISLPYREAP